MHRLPIGSSPIQNNDLLALTKRFAAVWCQGSPRRETHALDSVVHEWISVSLRMLGITQAFDFATGLSAKSVRPV